MKKVLLILFSVLGVLMVTGLFVLGYLGLFSPIANILGTNKPKDLGVKYTEADFKSVTEKINLEKVDAPTGTKTVYEGSREINQSFSSAELTALVNSSKWQYTPISDVQIKIGDNGFAESSGVLNLSLLPAYFDEVSPGIVTKEEVKNATNLLPDSIPYYVSGNIAFSNGQVLLNISNPNENILYGLISRVYAGDVSLGVASASVGKLNIPNVALESNKTRINSFINKGLSHIKGLQIDSLGFNSDKMNLQGKVPTKKYRPVR